MDFFDTSILNGLKRKQKYITKFKLKINKN